VKRILFLILCIIYCAGSAIAQNEQWMNGLNDNIFISQLSIPGAHNAATKGLSIAGKCQDKDIAGLWDAGVRVFDLRPTDAEGCPIYHGILSTGITLTTALSTITSKLSAYPSDFAIIIMRNENDGGSTDNWKSRVGAIMNNFSNYVIPLNPNLRLGDVRGKVIILSRDYYADGYTINGWGHSTPSVEASANGVTFALQDYYEVKDTDAKSSAITTLLTGARTNNSTSRIFINHTSGYVPGLIPGISDDITGNANTCNTLALNTITANPGPTGMILMDFAGSSSYNGANLCNKIIEQNSKISTSSPSVPATGQYYVYNVERDMYITRSNNYATRGGFDKAGMPIAVNNAGDGTLTLVTNVNGTGKGIFIADGNGETVYVDNTPTAWTLECIDEAKKIYTLKNGDNYLQAKDGQTRLEAGSLPTNKSAQWQFIPRNVREDLTVASATNPVDVTYLIENQGFDRYDGEQNSWKNADNSNWRPGNGWCHDADASNNCAEVWNANFDIHQSFTDLKNGVYELRVQGYYRLSINNNSDYLIEQMRAGNNVQRAKYYINSTEAYLLPQLSASLPSEYADYSVDINGTTYSYPNSKGKASIAFREGYYENEPIRAIVTDGNLSIGLKLDNKNGADWICFDNVRLAYLGAPDISLFTQALEQAITNAQAFSGNTTTILQNALTTALAEAIAVRQSTDTEVLTAKTEALNTALANAEAVDITILSATIPLAQADGIDVAEANNVIINGTTAAEVNNALATLRLARRVANAETHPDVFTGNAPAAGDYYLFNVGSGRFLCGGADWGAHAALGFPGVLVSLEATGTEGEYKLNTHLNNGDDNGNPKEYLNYEGYCDTWTTDAWKFISQGEGKYNIVRSNNETNLLGFQGGTYNNVITNCVTPTGPTNQWKLVTKAERDALLATATKDAPQDASHLIQSPNFSQREDVSAWKMTNASIWGRGSNHPDFAVESYNQDSASVEQTVRGLPAGIYQLKVQAFYRDGNFNTQAQTIIDGGETLQLATLYANTKSLLIPNVSIGADKAPGIGRSSSAGYMPDGIDDACLYFQNGLYWLTIEDIVVGADGTMTIGASKTEKRNDGDWMVLDNFRLTYLGPSVLIGDVNNDGSITIADVTALVNIILGKDAEGQYNHNAADVNDDSTITIADVTALVNIILGK
jgi:hypothetical protein